MPELPHILMVDDDATIRDAFSQYLRLRGYTVTLAPDGLEALEAFAAHRPDVVISDIQMPMMGGIDLLRGLRQLDAELPVVMVSGTSDLGHVVEALKLGAWDFLTKPLYDLALLGSTVDRVTERWRLKRELKRYQENLEDLVWNRTRDLVESNKELEYTRTQVVMRLAKAAEYRDTDTGNHIIRVSLAADRLARQIGMAEGFCDLIRLTSPMHDIGKIAIPDNILLKPKPLSAEEFEVMKTHAALGAKILAPVSSDRQFAERQHALMGTRDQELKESPMLEFAARIARSHHEKWDGSGYPDGLAGEAIPLEARIVAVADIYDALASKRPYKPAFSEDECLRHLRELSGPHLEPRLVQAFIDCLDDIRSLRQTWQD